MAKRSKRMKGQAPMGGMGMMQQLQQLQQQMEAAQNALAEEMVTATVGGGVVTVIATGDQQIQSITIRIDTNEPGIYPVLTVCQTILHGSSERTLCCLRRGVHIYHRI